MEEEIWRDIENYEGFYQVSNQGRIKSLDRYVNSKNGSVQLKKGKILKPNIDNGGYLGVSLQFNSKVKFVRIHRLVAITFIPNPNNLPIVLHKDDNPANNNVDNLKWGTHQDNKVIKKRQAKGEKQHLSKLNEQQVLEIREKYIPIIYSQRDLAKEYSVAQSTIKNIINRKTWKHI